MYYITSWKEVILRPSDFYQRMQKTGGYADSLAFAAISFIIYGLLTVIFNRGMYIRVSTVLLAAIVTPIAGIIFLFIGATVLDIIYKGRGGTGSYEGTVKLISYATAVMVLSWIPLAGMIVGIYGIYLCTVGGMFVHNVSMEKSVIVVFLLILVIFLLLSPFLILRAMFPMWC
jgi:hypothetical protein